MLMRASTSLVQPEKCARQSRAWERQGFLPAVLRKKRQKYERTESGKRLQARMRLCTKAGAATALADDDAVMYERRSRESASRQGCLRSQALNFARSRARAASSHRGLARC